MRLAVSHIVCAFNHAGSGSRRCTEVAADRFLLDFYHGSSGLGLLPRGDALAVDAEAGTRSHEAGQRFQPATHRYNRHQYTYSTDGGGCLESLRMEMVFPGSGFYISA